MLATASILGVEAPTQSGWVRLMPIGPLDHRDAGSRWRLTDPAAVAAASTRRMRKTDVVVDYDHQTERSLTNGQPAPAAGWIKRFDGRPDGLWGDIEWTERAAKLLANREFRYLSPTFVHDDGGEVQVVVRAALTNAPALDLPANTPTDPREEESMDPKKLRLALGLTEDAGDDAVQTAIEQMRSRSALLSAVGLDASADEAAAREFGASRTAALSALGLDATATAAEVETKKAPKGAPPGNDFVPRGEYDRLATEVKSMRTAQADAAALSAVDAAITDGKLSPAQREWGLSYARSDIKAFQTFAAAAPALLPSSAGNAPAPAGQPPAAAQMLGVTTEEWEASSKRLVAPA